MTGEPKTEAPNTQGSIYNPGAELACGLPTGLDIRQRGN